MSNPITSLKDRIEVAKKMASNGLSREIAMYVLEDTECLRLGELHLFDGQEVLASHRSEMVLQAYEGEGFFVEIALGRVPGLLPNEVFGSPQEYLEDILRLSLYKTELFDGVLLTCSQLLRRGDRPLGPALGGWLAAYLNDEFHRPTVKGPNPNKNLFRNDTIGLAVGCLEEVGFSPTRNQVSEKTSACDYVSEALSEVGSIALSYDAVAKIYFANIKSD